MINYGSVTFKCKKYQLIDEADFTGRVLSYRQDNFDDVSYGEEFTFEMSARAINSEGNEYCVYWIFSDTKGEVKELDEYDYDNVDRVELI